jgi:DNA polymerase-1
MPTLYIIDGYGQFFRAFHAIRTPMTSPVTKEPTNMSFGFVGMLLKLLRGESPNMARGGGKPDYVVVALDVSGDRETFRSEIYPDYKAQRPPIPESLPPQIERCLGILREIGVPILGAPGFEADDVIAALVKKLRRERPELTIRIVAKDKDLKQLLDGGDGGGGGSGGAGFRPADGGREARPTGSRGRVEMYDVHTDALLDEACFRAETGVSPAQWRDALALIGDTVDNVPGVPGVGEKTAAQLIREYGSLEGLMARAGEIKGKRGENLRAAAGVVELSRRLVTLRDDAPVELDLEAARASRFRVERLIPICRELGFNRYQDEVKALMEDGGGERSIGGTEDAGSTSVARGNTTMITAGGGFAGSLFEAAGVESPREVKGDYRAILTKGELEELVEELRRAAVVAVDTETTSLNPRGAKVCGISFSTREGQGVYIPVRSPTPERHMDERTVLDALRPVLEDPAIPKAGHNLKYDLLVFREHGVELRGISDMGAGAEDGGPEAGPAGEKHERESGCDSMVASYLIDSSRSSHAMDALALALLRRTGIPISDLLGSGKEQRCFDCVPIEQATPYAAEDADVALQLRNLMLPQIRAMGMGELWARVELPLVEVLAELEWNGVRVDPRELDKQRERLLGRIQELAGEVRKAAMESIGRAFNPDSPKQLASALFNKPTDEEPGLGLKVFKRLKTGPSTDIEVLERLAGDPEVKTPIPGLIVEYRQLTKLVGTYLESLKDAINPATGRVHSSFNQTGAATGRLSSSDPNLQNIPIRTDIGREIRKAFVAPPGRVLITADYSQIELRLLAHLSRDPALIAAFEAGEDIHTAVAAQIHGVEPSKVTREQRGGAKMVNFGIVYGITSWGLARRLKIEEKAAAEIIDAYKRRFAGITTFLEECIQQARRFGYVETILKRRRPITGIDARNPSERAMAERVAINSVVQGSAADLIKLAMIDLHGRLSEHAGHWRGRETQRPAAAGRLREGETRWRGPEIEGVQMLLQIHDELVFESPAGEAERARALIVERMEKAMELRVPLKVDSAIGANWFDGK